MQQFKEKKRGEKKAPHNLCCRNNSKFPQHFHSSAFSSQKLNCFTAAISFLRSDITLYYLTLIGYRRLEVRVFFFPLFIGMWPLRRVYQPSTQGQNSTSEQHGAGRGQQLPPGCRMGVCGLGFQAAGLGAWQNKLTKHRQENTTILLWFSVLARASGGSKLNPVYWWWLAKKSRLLVRAIWVHRASSGPLECMTFSFCCCASIKNNVLSTAFMFLYNQSSPFHCCLYANKFMCTDIHIHNINPISKTYFQSAETNIYPNASSAISCLFQCTQVWTCKNEKTEHSAHPATLPDSQCGPSSHRWSIEKEWFPIPYQAFPPKCCDETSYNPGFVIPTGKVKQTVLSSLV